MFVCFKNIGLDLNLTLPKLKGLSDNKAGPIPEQMSRGWKKTVGDAGTAHGYRDSTRWQHASTEGDTAKQGHHNSLFKRPSMQNFWTIQTIKNLNIP